MANGRNAGKRATGREPGGFVLMPWSVLDSAAYARLNHPAKALLMEIARQYVRDNNGRLLASRAYLAKRGWKSHDVIERARDELLNSGFIFETVKGHRPNKASWYAITWWPLDRHPGYDAGAAAGFVRSSYKASQNGYILSPSGGLGKAAIGPSGGLRTVPPSPSGGPIGAVSGTSPSPSGGHHLEKPSAAAARCSAVGAVPGVGIGERPSVRKAARAGAVAALGL